MYCIRILEPSKFFIAEMHGLDTGPLYRVKYLDFARN